LFTQSVKSPALLLILCATVLVIDSLVIFKLKQKATNWKLRLPLLANVAIPIGGYLAFSDQQDEMYIWASKIENFLLSGRLEEITRIRNSREYFWITLRVMSGLE